MKFEKIDYNKFSDEKICEKYKKIYPERTDLQI